MREIINSEIRFNLSWKISRKAKSLVHRSDDIVHILDVTSICVHSAHFKFQTPRVQEN